MVLVLTKDDPKFPTKEVGEIIERQGQLVQVRTRSGEIIETSVEKLTLNIEKHRKRCGAGLPKPWPLLNLQQISGQRGSQVPLRVGGLEVSTRRAYCCRSGASDELTLFNCYVIPSPQDSRGGIMKTLTEMTEIMARGEVWALICLLCVLAERW